MTFSDVFKVVMCGENDKNKANILRRGIGELDVNGENHVGVGFYAVNSRSEVFKGGHRGIIFDLSGHKHFRSVREPLYKGSDCTVIFFDKGSSSSINSIPEWFNEIHKHSTDTPIILVGYSNREKEILLSESDGKLIAEKFGAKYLECREEAREDAVRILNQTLSSASAHKKAKLVGF